MTTTDFDAVIAEDDAASIELIREDLKALGALKEQAKSIDAAAAPLSEQVKFFLGLATDLDYVKGRNLGLKAGDYIAYLQERAGKFTCNWTALVDAHPELVVEMAQAGVFNIDARAFDKFVEVAEHEDAAHFIRRDPKDTTFALIVERDK